MLPKPVPDEVFQEKDQQREDKDKKLRDGDPDGAQQGNEDRLEVDKADFRGEEEDGDSELDSELEALMRENSENSGSSSSENEGDSTSQAGEGTSLTKVTDNRVKRGSRNRSTYETPVNTVAVLVVACWMLRIPVMYRDFNRCVQPIRIVNDYIDDTIDSLNFMNCLTWTH